MSEKISAATKYPESLDPKTEEKYEKSSESEADLIDEVFKDAERELDSFVREEDERLGDVELDVSPEIIEIARKETGMMDSVSLLREKFAMLLAGLKEKLKKEKEETKLEEKEFSESATEKPLEKPAEDSEKEYKKASDAEKTEKKTELKIEVDDKGFPLKREMIRTVKILGGSSGVEMGIAGEDILFAVKRPRPETPSVSCEQFENQLKEEYIADAVYNLFGFAVPTSKFYGSEKVSHFVSGKDLRAIDRMEEKVYKGMSRDDIKKEVQRGFVLDCLLANWDVIGMDEDNIRIGDDGKIYRMDNGGSLHFRARGELKGEIFSREVGELETMRKDSAIFGEISDETITSQIREILSRKEDLLDTITRASVESGYSEETCSNLKEIIESRINYFSEWKDEYEKRIRGEFESVTTCKYFERWDDLIIEGNEGIKEKIRENIITHEKKFKNEFEGHSEYLGITVEEFKEKLQRKIEDVVSKSDFFRATSVSIFKKLMMEDHRWKSQFEVNRSDGCLDPRRRSEWEDTWFGFGDDVEKNREKRPIYGYFTSGKHGEINYKGTIPPPNSVSFYGKINFKVKKDVALRKATITTEDSLDNRGDLIPSPAVKPHFSSFDVRRSREFSKVENSKKKDWGSNYTEVQYHNGLTLDDIESIHISENNELDKEELAEIRKIFEEYKAKNPESKIELIEY